MHSLAHLSDLHLGSRASVRTAAALVDQLRAADTGTVLVTGDITDSGKLAQWRAYEELFAPLGDRLVTLPGNHDRCGDDVAALMIDRRVWTVKRPGLHLVCVDSTAPHNRAPFRSHGDVCDRVLDEIDAAVHRAGDDELCAVALHHHPVPLPVEDVWEWFSEAFGWPNAAELGLGQTLLRRLLGACDLVLHGHRHVPRELVADAPNGRPLRVLNAGATLQLGAYRVFDIAPGAYGHRWSSVAARKTPLEVPASELALST